MTRLVAATARAKPLIGPLILVAASPLNAPEFSCGGRATSHSEDFLKMYSPSEKPNDWGAAVSYNSSLGGAPSRACLSCQLAKSVVHGCGAPKNAGDIRIQDDG